MHWSHVLPVAVLAAATVLGGSAQKAASNSPGARLVLTVSQGEQATGRVLRTVVLECDPDGGSHPRPDAACTVLRAAQGELSAVQAEQEVMCPMMYAPVRVEAVGDWHGRATEFTRVYANRCVAAGETGGVFRF